MRDEEAEEKKQEKEEGKEKKKKKLKPTFGVMVEATKAIKNLSKTKEVIDMLMKNDDLKTIMLKKYNIMDSQSQEYILETVSAACQLSKKYRTTFVSDKNFRNIPFSKLKTILTMNVELCQPSLSNFSLVVTKCSCFAHNLYLSHLFWCNKVYFPSAQNDF